MSELARFVRIVDGDFRRGYWKCSATEGEIKIVRNAATHEQQGHPEADIYMDRPLLATVKN